MNESFGPQLELPRDVGRKLYALFTPVIMMPSRLLYWNELRHVLLGLTYQ